MIKSLKHWVVTKAGRCGQRLSKLEDTLFTENRLLFLAIGIVLGYAGLLALKMSEGRSVFGPDGTSLCYVDFCTNWVSGKFAVSSNPAEVYNYSLFSAAQMAFVGPPSPGFPAYHYAYPPTYLFFTYPLGLLSYFAAFVAWAVFTLVLYETAVYMIVPRLSALFLALTPVVVTENILLGQNGLLVAGLIGLSLASIERRPWVSGGIVALLTCKPQFGVGFPLAFLGSRNWRAFAASTVASAIFVMAAAMVFGVSTWPSFVSALFDRNSSLSSDEGVEITQQSVFGFIYWASGSVTTPLLLHMIVAVAAAVTLTLIWNKPIPHTLKSAALCLSTMMITPYIEMYDFCVLSIAVAFLIKDGLIRGFLVGERVAIVFCFVSLLFSYLPIGAAVYLVLSLVLARRIRVWFKDGFSALSPPEPRRP